MTCNEERAREPRFSFSSWRRFASMSALLSADSIMCESPTSFSTLLSCSRNLRRRSPNYKSTGFQTSFENIFKLTTRASLLVASKVGCKWEFHTRRTFTSAETSLTSEQNFKISMYATDRDCTRRSLLGKSRSYARKCGRTSPMRSNISTSFSKYLPNSRATCRYIRAGYIGSDD